VCDAVAKLFTPEAVRQRCGQIFEKGLGGSLAHFDVVPERAAATADLVVDTIGHNYPDLAIPYHARWRHFTVDGTDLWHEPFAHLEAGSSERARARFDLAITSVLLDAGAGDAWTYRHPSSGRAVARSEGLALASLDAFAAGSFSSQDDALMQADAQGLVDFTSADLAAAFQVTDANPLVGLDGRVALLNRLGKAMSSHPTMFRTETPRPGDLFDHLKSRAANGTLEAREILIAVLNAFEAIWPGRLALGGRNLGDTWHHRAITADDGTGGLVPFHKLSQWLSYSLVEPLQEAGIRVTHLDQLTGLAEYRNGGLLVDCGLLRPKHDGILGGSFAPDSEVIVEWRALTVASLDMLAGRVRETLDKSVDELPLASVLEGGTWAAGRRIAADMRPGGGPPISLISDGSVF
jgi:hypothetical protein